MSPRVVGWIRYLIVAIVCVAGSTHAGGRVRFRLEPRDVVETRLKSFSTNNKNRELLIRKWFAESGCNGPDLSEQSLERKLPPNVICVLDGKTPAGEGDRIIVVGAHTDHVDDFGDGVVDNWTGAALLPSLLYSLSAQPRRHTFIFVGFSAEEKGLVGSQYFAAHLSAKERERVDGIVNLDSLGLGPTEVWATHADRVLLDPLAAVAAESKIPLSAMNVDDLGTADSESFVRYHMPRITLHSLTSDTWAILHSPRDKLAAVKMGDYYDSYRLIAEYLAYLDQALKPAATADKPRH
jgi:hypothetical protein